jgi:predicted phosphodiesterase
MPNTKDRFKAELLRLKAKLGKAPTSDEWDAQAKISRRQVLKAFGTYSGFLLAHGEQPGSSGGKIIPPELSAAREKAKDLERQLHEEKHRNKALRLLGSMEPPPHPEWLSRHNRRPGSNGIPMLFISDVHFDEVVRPQEINYPNEYNRAIAVKRLRRVFEQSVYLLKTELASAEYDGFVLALGGDMVSGNIHKELRESNEEKILKTCLDMSTYLKAGIELLADEFGRVFVPCVTGNHGRLNEKYHFKARARDNFDWLIYQLLARDFEGDKRVVIHAPETPDVRFDINGKKFLLTHGDQFKGGSGISGIFTPISLGSHRKQKKMASLGQGYDILMCGHFHQYIHTESVLVNGSVKGYDEFADQFNFPPEPAQQSLCVISQSGHIPNRMPILCDGFGKETQRKAAKAKEKIVLW